MNRPVIILIGSIAVILSGTALRSAQQRAADALPTWDWSASRQLLTEPTSFCGPILQAPGKLHRAELLAWRTNRASKHRDSTQRQEIRDVFDALPEKHC